MAQRIKEQRKDTSSKSHVAEMTISVGQRPRSRSEAKDAQCKTHEMKIDRNANIPNSEVQSSRRKSQL